MLRVRRVFNSGTFRGSRRSPAGRDTAGRLGARGARCTTFATRASFRAASAYVARRRAAASACLLRLAGVSLLNAALLDASGGTVTPGKSRRRNSRQTASVTGARSRPEPANVPDSTRSRTSGVSFAGRAGARGGSRRSRWGGAGGDARSGRERVRGRRRGRCVVESGRRRCPRASARSPIAPDPPRASARARLILSAAIVVNPSWGRTDCPQMEKSSCQRQLWLFTSRRPTESRERRLRATHGRETTASIPSGRSWRDFCERRDARGARAPPSGRNNLDCRSSRRRPGRTKWVVSGGRRQICRRPPR